MSIPFDMSFPLVLYLVVRDDFGLRQSKELFDRLNCREKREILIDSIELEIEDLRDLMSLLRDITDDTFACTFGFVDGKFAVNVEVL